MALVVYLFLILVVNRINVESFFFLFQMMYYIDW